MEEPIVITKGNATDYLEKLILILYKNEYFGFEESAQNYISKIYDFIEFNLPLVISRKTPKKLVVRV